MTLVSRSASSIRRSSLPGPEEMLLPGEFVQRPRPHPHRQRSDPVKILLANVAKEVHAAIVPASGFGRSFFAFAFFS